MASNGIKRKDCLIKLVDVKEMGYTSNDQPFPRGLLFVKTPDMFNGKKYKK